MDHDDVGRLKAMDQYYYGVWIQVNKKMQKYKQKLCKTKQIVIKFFLLK